MAVQVDQIVEAAAAGVIRALHARREGQEQAIAYASPEALVRSGFAVEILIRAGGLKALELASLQGVAPSTPVALG